MNTPEQEEILIAAVSSAHRDRDVDGNIRFHPGWFDLDDAGRRRAFEAAAQVRRLEAALDPEGRSSTAKAVMARIRRGG